MPGKMTAPTRLDQTPGLGFGLGRGNNGLGLGINTTIAVLTAGAWTSGIPMASPPKQSPDWISGV